MIGAWVINVGGQIYGPYSSERMRGFAGEGRLVAESLVTREGTHDWHQANDEPEFAGLFGGDTMVLTRPVVTAPVETAAPGRTRFIIVLDLKSRASDRLEQAIYGLGIAHKLLPNVWIVSSEQTVNGVRNQLVPELGKLDSLFVADATRDKAAWFNFGPEADVKIRRVWQKTP